MADRPHLGTSPKGLIHFLAVPRELSVLHEETLRAERTVARLWGALPGAARWAHVRSLVMDEIYSSNLIEGVNSSRREIAEALNSIQLFALARGERRFGEFARLYLGITDSSSSLPQTPQDIRAIYDRVTAGEVDSSDAPDGALFRANPVDIVSSKQKCLHTGVDPESKIVGMLEQMLSLVTSRAMPSVYAALLAHFLFEYIHPFYDGNGRTGRYLLALYLSDALSVTTALSLSHTIASNKGVYYRAFESVEKPMNHAEATFFVMAMLRLVRLAQEEAIVGLQEKSYKLEQIAEPLDAMASSFDLSPKAAGILRYMAQTHLFELPSTAALSQIARHQGHSEQTARKYLQELETKQLVQTISRKPLVYTLSPLALRALELD